MWHLPPWRQISWGTRLWGLLAARPGIAELLGSRVHLDLHVAVESDWQRDPKKLDRLGF